MFIFVDESGVTDEKSRQKFLVVAFVLSGNRQFVDELVFEIRDKCKARGKPVVGRELKYHDLAPFQREIAVQVINSRYRNFFVCFFDVETASKGMVSGRFEHVIQRQAIHNVLSKLDARLLKNHDSVKVVMDRKLGEDSLQAIEDEFQKHLGMKKGVSVRSASSSKERGIQVADLIAGAFRAKLLKKSGLFEVDQTRVFQITFDEKSLQA